MKKLLTATAAATALFSASAFAGDDASDIEITQPMKMGDARLSCDAIIAEAGRMETVLGGSPASGLMDAEQLAGMGTSLAQQAMISSGAGGKALGAVGQVGGLLGRSSKKKKEKEAMRKAIAEKRWIYMVGLYEGRNCDAAPVEAAPAEVVE
ncbi:hypothetical protein [Hyphococcus sp. DH-69]|uniref:hypothetical protein n=1 Tax=Hyphococcus formosus TaxID=3143534 RepID=UPI00398B50F9